MSGLLGEKGPEREGRGSITAPGPRPRVGNECGEMVEERGTTGHALNNKHNGFRASVQANNVGKNEGSVQKHFISDLSSDKRRDDDSIYYRSDRREITYIFTAISQSTNEN